MAVPAPAHINWPSLFLNFRKTAEFQRREYSLVRTSRCWKKDGNYGVLYPFSLLEGPVTTRKAWGRLFPARTLRDNAVVLSFFGQTVYYPAPLLLSGDQACFFEGVEVVG